MHCQCDVEMGALDAYRLEVQRTQQKSQRWKRKTSGKFCVMHQEHTSSHFHQQKQFLEAVFFLAANACLICKTSAADSDGWLCYFFGMQGTVNMLNGAILNMFLS